jgi:hypothetical protein
VQLWHVCYHKLVELVYGQVHERQPCLPQPTEVTAVHTHVHEKHGFRSKTVNIR